MTHETETWIVMNDGVRLDASVVRPHGEPPDGGWPGLLLVHGHGDTGSKAATLDQGRRFAARGYLVVCYSVRGQGCSEGLTFHLGAREVFDLQDVIDWMLVELPVHPQKLGVVGSSQGGWHAYMAAAHHPQVATVVPQNICTDLADFAVRNGCLTRWFFLRTMRRRIMSAGLQELSRQWAIAGEWDRLRAWLRPTSPRLFVNRIRCPVFILHGWHDMGMPPNEVIELYEALTVAKKLYLGGGGHEGQDTVSAEAQRQSLIDRWLDHWLKGEETGILAEPAITYMGRPGWETVQTDTLSPSGLKHETLYLQEGNILRPTPPTGPTAHANINNVPLRPDYDLQSAIYDDMAGVEQALAREVSSFAGEPFAEAAELLGAPTVRFYMQSNARSFQVHVNLYDVAEDGTAIHISHGQFGTRDATPGRHLTVEFACSAISYRLPAGHRLRLDVSNYNIDYAFPYFEPFCTRLYHDNVHPSAIDVPLRTLGTVH